MTYDTERQTVGRQPVTLVKLYFDSGTLLLSKPDLATFGTYDSLQIDPTITPGSVRITPPRINYLDPEKLGEVGKVQFTVKDTPEAAGTQWGKQLAADPYYLNRKMEVLTGYLVGGAVSSAGLETRTYLITEIDGPDSAGNVRITGKSPLSEVLDKRNVAPAADETNLDGALTAVATTIDILPAGTIAAWATSGKVRINDEVIAYTGITSDQLTGCTRAQDGTTAAAHSDGDAVQRCLEYSNAALNTVINDLLDNHTNLAAAYFDTTQWAAEVATWLNADRLDRVITKPTPVATLIAEACADSLAVFYYNDRTGKFVLKAVAPEVGGASVLTEANNILKGSQSVKRDLSELATRVLVYYDPIKATENDKPEDFKRATLRVDADRESSGQWNLVKTKIHFARWIKAAGAATVTKLASRTLARFGDGVTNYTFALDAGDPSDAWIGDRLYINTRLQQETDGTQVDQLIQIIECEEIDGHERRYVATKDVFSGGRYALVIANGAADYTSASAADKAKYGWISNNTPQMSNGDDPYLII
jgi:hypothetical protein